MTEPEGTSYAGPVSRTIAYVIDILLVATVFTAGVLIAALIGAVVFPTHGNLPKVAVSVYLLFLPATLALYNTVFWALAGRTPGMALLGVRVVAISGRRVSWFAALIRGAVLAYFPIGAAWILVDSRHQGIHDKLARTAVVRMRAPATDAAVAPRPPQPPVAAG
ncbi:RDD family protein [Krasilnikovia sp. MM14-A1259]|uniref:RDD family protein n=1 Tax=Krasilnikovia sp. MM14-A1259 TaxID=3373539 RepID=UPI0037FBF3E8